jgi:hypothetical protein
MEHLLLKAAVTPTTDAGVFEAVISTATVDRERDIVDPHGMVRALAKWVPLGKKVPLAWNHSQEPGKQIGYLDPASAKVVGQEVVASGWIDQSTPVGADAWRLVKAGTLGFSFGYMVLTGGATPRKGGGRHLRDFDVFEVTGTTTPMNNDTRVLAWKASTPADGEADPAELLGVMISMAQAFIDAEGDPADVAAMRQIMRALLTLQGTEADETDTGKALRRRADDVALAHVSGGAGAGDRPPTPPPPPADLPAGADWLFPAAELAAVRAGELKAVWSTSYVNDLPDSAFLYVEPGGEKDADGRTTPRSLRHFPYKDASGAVDLPHLRNALARIPQSDLPQNVKEELTAKAQRLLDAQKSIVAADVTDPEVPGPRSVDPLRRQADAVALDFLSNGESRRHPHDPRTRRARSPSTASLSSSSSRGKPR